MCFRTLSVFIYLLVYCRHNSLGFKHSLNGIWSNNPKFHLFKYVLLIASIDC